MQNGYDRWWNNDEVTHANTDLTTDFVSQVAEHYAHVSETVANVRWGVVARSSRQITSPSSSSTSQRQQVSDDFVVDILYDLVRQSLSHFVFDVQTVLVVSILHCFDGPARLQLTGTSFNNLVDNFHGHTTTTSAFQSTARTTNVATVECREASLCTSCTTSVVDQCALTVNADQTWSTWAYTARTSCEASVCTWSVTSCYGVSTKTTRVETVDWVGSKVVVVVTECFRIRSDRLNAVGTFVSIFQTQGVNL
ncbi:hypothetical protein D3C87_1210220 [compost metagenome]